MIDKTLVPLDLSPTLSLRAKCGNSLQQSTIYYEVYDMRIVIELYCTKPDVVNKGDFREDMGSGGGDWRASSASSTGAHVHRHRA